MKACSSSRSLTAFFLMLLACALGMFLAAKGIRNESVIEMNGDMPKYLMNGAYFYDLARDLLSGRASLNIFDHASRYFARYPALSLGHHPVLLGVAISPFYAIFGVSVFSARIGMMAFLLLGIVTLYLLVKRSHDETVAAFSALIFATTPYIIQFSRIVMSELPTISLLILTTYFFFCYCDTDKPRYAYLLGIAFALSLYSKHLVIFMAPIYLIVLAQKKGLNALLRREVLLTIVMSGLLIAPLGVITMKFSRSNVRWVAQAPLETRVSSSNLLFYVRVIWQRHLTLPILALSGLGALFSLMRRDARALFFLLWIVCCYLFFTGLGIHEHARYAIFWIPAFCVLAASVVDFFPQRWWKMAVSAVILLAIAYQTAMSAAAVPVHAKGYEDAAKYVTAHPKGDAILYSGVIDTSYFVFFVRKYDPDRTFIVLRSDKIFATSRMNKIIAERVQSKAQIHELLQKYGVGYVVLEEMPSTSQALEWLREEAHSDRFILRETIPFDTDFRWLKQAALGVYEYKDARPAAPEEVLDMDIPLMGETLRIRMKDLLPAK